MERLGVSLLIDSMSYQYLTGSEIDFKDDLEGAQFVIRNPNAVTTCWMWVKFFGVKGFNLRLPFLSPQLFFCIPEYHHCAIHIK